MIIYLILNSFLSCNFKVKNQNYKFNFLYNFRCFSAITLGCISSKPFLKLFETSFFLMLFCNAETREFKWLG